MSETTAIPKLFHWIWVGDAPLPSDQREWMEGWLRRHPGWDHRVWTDQNRPRLRNESAYVAASAPAQKSDVLRYEVVHEYGGVYLDTDVECLGNIEPLLVGCDAFIGEEPGGTVGTAIFGARPLHPWIDHIIEQLPRSILENPELPLWRQIGPDFVTRVTVRRSDVTVFPEELFYPFEWYEEPSAARAGPRSYAIHHYKLSWLEEVDRRLLDDLPRTAATIDAFPRQGKAVVIGGWLSSAVRTRRQLVHMPADGLPVDTAELVEELERARSDGAVLLVFLEPEFWWFDEYPDFMTHVGSISRLVFTDRLAKAFELRTPAQQ